MIVYLAFAVSWLALTVASIALLRTTRWPDRFDHHHHDRERKWM